jgi:hypothetical protein
MAFHGSCPFAGRGVAHGGCPRPGRAGGAAPFAPAAASPHRPRELPPGAACPAVVVVVVVDRFVGMPAAAAPPRLRGLGSVHRQAGRSARAVTTREGAERSRQLAAEATSFCSRTTGAGDGGRRACGSPRSLDDARIAARRSPTAGGGGGCGGGARWGDSATTAAVRPPKQLRHDDHPPPMVEDHEARRHGKTTFIFIAIEGVFSDCRKAYWHAQIVRICQCVPRRFVPKSGRARRMFAAPSFP